MALSMSQNYTAVVPSATFPQFLAAGGTPPYVYAVTPGGAGGSIDSSTGAYTAPSTLTAYPANKLYDIITVTDSLAATVSAQILVASPLFLFCEIIQKQLALDNNHVFLWDQKLFQPTDSGMYIAVSVDSPKPFSNNNQLMSDGNTVQSVNMYAQLGLNVISRGPEARDHKELVILALNSTYSQQQQEANGFYIGKISTGFINLSQIDGAAIPYRFHISVAIQYAVSLTTSQQFYDTFALTQNYTNP